jgi:hypothetical protein
MSGREILRDAVVDDLLTDLCVVEGGLLGEGERRAQQPDRE